MLHRAMLYHSLCNIAQPRGRPCFLASRPGFSLLAAQRVFRGFRTPSGGFFQWKNARARARGDPRNLLKNRPKLLGLRILPRTF